MDKTIEQMILESFNEKINNGYFENIINNKLEEFFQRILDDLLVFNSSFKENMKKRLDPILTTAISNSRLENLTDKVTLLVNNLLANSELYKASKLQENLASYLASYLDCGKNKPYIEKIKLSDIFNKYVEFAKNECKNFHYNKKDLSFEFGTACLNFSASLEEIKDDSKRDYFDTRERKFILKTNFNKKCNHTQPKLDIEFKINNFGYLNFTEDISINRIHQYPPFIWLLIRLSQICCEVYIDEPANMKRQFDVEINEEEWLSIEGI